MTKYKLILYKNPSVKVGDTNHSYLNKVLLNQLHNHRVVIRYLLILIVILITYIAIT